MVGKDEKKPFQERTKFSISVKGLTSPIFFLCIFPLIKPFGRLSFRTKFLKKQ